MHEYRPTARASTRKLSNLRAAGAEKVLRETASGANTDRAQLRRALDELAKGDVLMVTRPAGALDPLPLEHDDDYHRQGRGLPLPERSSRRRSSASTPVRRRRARLRAPTM
jgi:resolvase-like protein